MAAVLVTDTAFIRALPPILPILDVSVAERVQTHPSFNAEPTQDFEFPELMGNDFRRDALLGDALLKLHLTELLYKKFPQLTPGAATIILSVCWSNVTLAKLAESYGLHNGLRAASSQRRTLMLNSDVNATLFEAHLYGAYATGGDEASSKVKTFISKLFTPVLEKQREVFRITSQARTVAAAGFEDWVSKLNLWSQRRGALIEYATVGRSGPDHMPSFEVEVKVNRILQGTGSGASIKEAKQEAASMAMVALCR